MFTGIITDLGSIRDVSNKGDARIEIDTTYDLKTIKIGASIACSGICLTVIGIHESFFVTQVSGETVSKTTVADWSINSKVNLERPLKLDDEIGGHMITGHVDGVGIVSEIKHAGESLMFDFEVPNDLMRYIATKGSIAVNGVSLTINDISKTSFNVE